jgi:hypothetical protein
MSKHKPTTEEVAAQLMGGMKEAKAVTEVGEGIVALLNKHDLSYAQGWSIMLGLVVSSIADAPEEMRPSLARRLTFAVMKTLQDRGWLPSDEELMLGATPPPGPRS